MKKFKIGKYDFSLEFRKIGYHYYLIPTVQITNLKGPNYHFIYLAIRFLNLNLIFALSINNEPKNCKIIKLTF